MCGNTICQDRRFLAKDYSFEARKKIIDSKDGWSPMVWAQLTEMGLMGLPFSLSIGGACVLVCGAWGWMQNRALDLEDPALYEASAKTR